MRHLVRLDRTRTVRAGNPCGLRRGAWIGAAVALVVAGCAGGTASPSPEAKSIVVTYSILGSVVKDLVGDAATVTVLMPNGADPHEWEPSARDIETMTKADLLVENGLNLEGGMGNAFTQAEQAGVKRFIASDHITIRHVGAGEGADPSDPDQAPGAEDPHLWMDPLTMKDVVAALATQLESDLGMDVSARATDLEARLTTLNDQVATVLHDRSGGVSAPWSPATSRSATSRSAMATSSSAPSSRACRRRPRPRRPTSPRSKRRSRRPASSRSSPSSARTRPSPRPSARTPGPRSSS